MIANVKPNQTLKWTVAHERKTLNQSVVCISQFYLAVLKTIRINATHYVMMITPDKKTARNSIKSFVPLSNTFFYRFHEKFTRL